MKRLLYVISILFISAAAYPQSGTIVRNMHSIRIGKDSVIIYFDEYYEVVEPDCSVIVRHGHFDFSKGRYIGKFKDVIKSDSSFVASEGSYSNDGLKEGKFVIRYLSGTVQASGRFKNDNYDGKWSFYHFNGHLKERATFKDGRYDGKREFYNNDGSPNVFMTITGDKCEITDVWTAEGEKVVNNGNGEYITTDAALPWKGKLLNGLPDGIWSFQISDVVYGNEIFDKGRFIKGYSHSTIGASKYSDRSRIHFLPYLPKLVLLNSEFLAPISNISCDGIDYRKIRTYRTRIFDNNAP